MPRKANDSPQTRTVLAEFALQPSAWRYGYDLHKTTGIKFGTLYPLLMRLHEQGLLAAEWRQPEAHGRPPRHAYRLTATGRALAAEQRAEEAARLACLQSAPVRS